MQPLPNRKILRHLGQLGSTSAWLLIGLLVLLAVAGYAASRRQALYDWMALRNYKPPTAVSQLATQDTMTAYGRHIFYVNHPLLDVSGDFSNHCPSSKREQTIVLGCYHAGQNGIFLLKVNDGRLNGVMQVTAAHEMLHAAYDRLSTAERNRVNTMLLEYYNHGLTDTRIKKTIAAYRVTEPNDLVNEMHSIFGTEVANLPSGLEQYYAQYFNDRRQVAAYAGQYEAVFTSREAAVAQDDAQLSSMKAQIQSLQNSLAVQQTQINNQRAALLAMRNSGDINGYNAGVPAFNSLIDNYNNGAQTLQALVTQYNQLVAARNAIALQEDQLVNELSTGAMPIQQ